MNQYYPESRDRRLRAPSDDETGVPLPIAPFMGMDRLQNGDMNLHHAVYPKLHPTLKSLGGQALRVARLQVVPQWLHNGSSETAYHNMIGNGIRIPEKVEEQAGMVTLLVAGYIPRQVVDTTQGDPIVRYLRKDERLYLTRTQEPRGIDDSRVDSFRQRTMPGESLSRAKDILLALVRDDAAQRYRTMYYGEAQVRTFVRDFVLNQDISIFNRRLMEKFIKYGEPSAGLTLLGQAAAAAALRATVQGKPLDVVYKDSMRQGLLNPNLNPKPASYLMGALGTAHGRIALLPVFRQGLTRAVEEVA